MKFTKKPIQIEAIKWNGATIGLTNGGIPFETERLEMPEWMPPCRVVSSIDIVEDVSPGSIVRKDDDLFIGTLEGTHRASPGDWIIRGIKGELYPCKPDIFEATYSPAA